MPPDQHDALCIEARTGHFGLLEAERVRKHVDDMLAIVCRPGPNPTPNRQTDLLDP